MIVTFPAMDSKMNIAIDNKSYTFIINYVNSYGGGWFLSIVSKGVALINNVPLVYNNDCLQLFHYIMPYSIVLLHENTFFVNEVVLEVHSIND